MFNEIYVPAAKPLYHALLPIVTKDTPDLIVLDIGTLGAHDLAHHLNIPYVINSPTLLFELEDVPPYVPAWGTGFSRSMSLWSRCMNVLFPRLLSVALTPPFMQLNKIRWELDLPPFRSQHDIFRGSRVILNTAFGLDYPRPVSPLITMVGPVLPPEVIPTQRPDPLPPLIRNWLEGNTKQQQAQPLDIDTLASQATGYDGVVYVSLGSMPHFDAWQARTLVQGLTPKKGKGASGGSGFRVLWTLPNDQRTSLPTKLPSHVRVKVLGGVPHLKVLAHPAVRVVISHCGMGSAQEALYFYKPVLCLPFFVDQPDVAARLIDSGAGLMLDKNQFDEDEVRARIRELYHNASYVNAARQVGKALRAAGGVRKAADVIGSTLRIGTKHLQPIESFLPWHKVVMADVYAVYVAILSVMIVVLRNGWLVFSFISGRLFSSSRLPAAEKDTSSSSCIQKHEHSQ